MSLLTFALIITLCFFTLLSIKNYQVTICNMAICFILPNVNWKIENVSGYCKRKSPYFTIRNTKWQLKFIYSKTPQDVEACQISLKCSGNESTCDNIVITSWCMFAGNRCFERTVKYNYSELKEMAIFREPLQSFKQNREIGNYFTSICEFWEKSFFVCCFTIKNWAPIPEGPKIKNFMNSTELKEMTVWQESWNSIAAYKSETNNYTDISSFWEKTVFVCSFTVKSWTPNDVPQATNHEDSIPVDRSPCITSMCHDFGKLYNNQTMSDVTLISERTKIYAHRNILSARSDVFAAMFRNDMKESKERTVDITDVDGTVLEILVRYMYSGKVLNLSLENIHKVYAAADKYGVEALKMKCAIYMVDNPSENVSQSNLLSSESSTNDVKQIILSHFANIKNVLCSDEWKKLTESEPEFAHKAFLFFVSKSPS